MTCGGLKNANKSADYNIFMYLKISACMQSLQVLCKRYAYYKKCRIFVLALGEKIRNK